MTWLQPKLASAVRDDSSIQDCRKFYERVLFQLITEQECRAKSEISKNVNIERVRVRGEGKRERERGEDIADSQTDRINSQT